jgi:hypothetical protein
VIIVLVAFAGAVARICRGLVALGLRYWLNIYSVGGRILISLFVPLFLLLRDLRYV